MILLLHYYEIIGQATGVYVRAELEFWPFSRLEGCQVSFFHRQGFGSNCTNFGSNGPRSGVAKICSASLDFGRLNLGRRPVFSFKF